MSINQLLTFIHTCVIPHRPTPRLWAACKRPYSDNVFWWDRHPLHLWLSAFLWYGYKLAPGRQITELKSFNFVTGSQTEWQCLIWLINSERNKLQPRLRVFKHKHSVYNLNMLTKLKYCKCSVPNMGAWICTPSLLDCPMLLVILLVGSWSSFHHPKTHEGTD